MKLQPMIKNTNFELLLPVGQKEMALAAIHNGADAIYVGFPGFNARGRSYDFEVQELKEIIDTCHLYGVKVNLAFNIVIFEEEIAKVVTAIHDILPLKPDALIVQDLGLAQIIRKIAPLQPIHASTQMTITNDLAIQFVDDLRIKRFVLGRENSLPEIKLIKEKTDKELEVFVHGALCVSYSGQCFTSESLGGRSANRGQCAQSCRFSYDLIVDGEKYNTLDKNYLVSPQDLCGIQEIPELMKIGVTSFKIEGRLKTPEFVASSAKEFRTAMDRYLKGKNLNSSEIAEAKKNMATQYSRGFFSGWLHGVDHQQLVDGTFSSHRGALIGTVIGREDNSILLVELTNETAESSTALKPGDGLLWTLGDKEWGSFIFSVEKVRAKIYRIGISKDLRTENDFTDAKLYLNHNKDLKKDLNKSFQDKNYFKRIPVKVEIIIDIDKPVLAKITDDRFLVQGQSASNTSLAQKRPLSDEDIRNEFDSLSGSAFKLEELNIIRTTKESVFLNAKDLKNLRQNLIAELTIKRSSQRIEVSDFDLLTEESGEYFKFDKTSLFEVKLQNIASSENNENTYPEFQVKPSNTLKFNVLLRSREQVDDLCLAINDNKFSAQDFNCIILDFEFGRDYQSSMDKLRALDLKIGIATTRILKPQEYTNLKIIAGLKPDMILARNLGAIHYFQKINPFQGQLLGDFSLNVTNHLTADYLLSKNLASLCLSYDLNQSQVSEILKNSAAERLEITVHQFMPSFHMEHCVFAAFLSKGSSFKDCGKPCEKHHVQLRDQFNNLHWIKPDHECRNTMFNAKAQTAIKFVADWKNLGLGNIRYEALHETGAELISKIQSYVLYLKGNLNLDETLKSLKTTETYGLSEGSFSKEHKYQSRKKDFSTQDY
jgi:putative protease